MKILQINVTYGVGSTGKIVQDIHNHLISQGIDSSVIYGRSFKSTEQHIYYIGSKLSLYIDVFLTRITGLVGYFSWISTIKLILRVKKLKPNIIHIHNIHGYYVNMPLLFRFLRKYNHKLILTLHDEFFYTGKCTHSKNCKKFESECYECPLIKDYPKSLGLDFSKFMHRSKKRWLSDFNDLTIVVPSRWLEKKLQFSFLKSFTNLVINNGIDTTIFRYKKENVIPIGIDKSKFIVLSIISKFEDANKGFHIIRRIAEEAEGSDLLFVVVGFKGKISNLPKNIIYVPKTNSQLELVKYYSSSDLYLMVSEFENYPTVTLEASATSLPILAFDAGGTKETIIGVQGKVLPYNSPYILNEIYNLKTIIQSKNYKKVRNPQLDTIDKSKMIDAYMSVYQGVSL